MTTRVVDNSVIKSITKDNVYTEIHRLEGRMDFLLICDDIPKDIRDREITEAERQMQLLQNKLLVFHIKGEL